MSNTLPPALREALDAQYRFGGDPFTVIERDRARTMAAALRWALTVDGDPEDCVTRVHDAIAALEQESERT